MTHTNPVLTRRLKRLAAVLAIPVLSAALWVLIALVVRLAA